MRIKHTKKNISFLSALLVTFEKLTFGEKCFKSNYTKVIFHSKQAWGGKGCLFIQESNTLASYCCNKCCITNHPRNQCLKITSIYLSPMGLCIGCHFLQFLHKCFIEAFLYFIDIISFILIFILYWTLVDLQCRGSFRCTAKDSIINMLIYSFSNSFLI